MIIYVFSKGCDNITQCERFAWLKGETTLLNPIIYSARCGIFVFGEDEDDPTCELCANDYVRQPRQKRAPIVISTGLLTKQLNMLRYELRFFGENVLVTSGRYVGWMLVSCAILRYKFSYIVGWSFPALFSRCVSLKRKVSFKSSLIGCNRSGLRTLQVFQHMYVCTVRDSVFSSQGW